MRALRGLLIIVSWTVWPVLVLIVRAASGHHQGVAGDSCWLAPPRRTLPLAAALALLPLATTTVV